ncbi:phosphopantetheine-binding protein [Montanilutibacter psychrotolerans]|uniref:Acyl carrier protein n=1 Tax=Montanilutibacter psychrotolerans TaxID=1327343 RepID=A0A3M8T2Q0_9GAMM|nr:phosphopantetheine-binding protein [Lysobacter psychrotolerans]RNF85400.1 acyl carrier protein [Lysobacter psychrotolerans]
MESPYSHAALIDLVMDTLCGVLGCDRSELTADHAIGNDLGAESLDFVELRYNLERTLGIVLPQRSVLDHYGAASGDPQALYVGGKLSEIGAYALQNSFFAYSSKLAHAGAGTHEVMAGATISNWAGLLKGVLDCLPAQCPDCGHEHAVIAPSGKPACAACGSVVKPLAGDEAMALSMQEAAAGWESQKLVA